jgi:hypothetical protein
MDRVAAGEEPFTSGAIYEAAFDTDKLVPAGWVVERRHQADGIRCTLARTSGASVRIRQTSEAITVWWSAASEDALLKMVNQIDHLMPRTEERLPFRLWQWRQHQGYPASVVRSLEPQPWADVRRNYPGRVAEQLDRLMAMTRPDGGRLIMWHGEPGTGKSRAATTLMREWSAWCDPHVIVDTERLFEMPEYLTEVLTSWPARTRRLDERPPWRLIVAEDADDFLRVDARSRTGGALGRLLNATDGILATGMRAIVLLTTNDEVNRLEPALTRPGRCLSVIGFERFEPEEATAWLGRESPSADGQFSLAELFAVSTGACEAHVMRTRVGFG